jgi:hypothetical protein
MDWPVESMERLYDLYLQHIERLRRDVIEVNKVLGAARPSMRLEAASRLEFEALLKNWRQDPEGARLWIRRIIRGHEQEFPKMEVA